MQEKFLMKKKQFSLWSCQPFKIVFLKVLKVRPDDIPEALSPGDGGTDCRKEEGWRQHKREAGPGPHGF